MELFTLNEYYDKIYLIDEFESVIWTERYIGGGDVELVVPTNTIGDAAIYEGTFLGLVGSLEVMYVHTREVEGEKVKFKGKTLDSILESRIMRSAGSVPSQSGPVTGTPGLMLDIIIMSTIGDAAAGWMGGLERLGYDKNSLANLEVPGYWAAVAIGGPHSDDTGGWVTNYMVTNGPADEALKTLATTYEVGYSLHLAQTTEEDYVLRFIRYKGRDLTREQSLYPPVQFSPALDNLTDIKELNSVVGYKNICYALPTNYGENIMMDPGVAYAYPTADATRGFARKAMFLHVSDIPWEEPEGGVSAEVAWAYFQPILEQRARDALANNNYTKVVDGQVVPQTGFSYGVDYKLGDIVELVGRAGIGSFGSPVLQKARITEFIRSHDADGERAYPTVSVIE